MDEADGAGVEGDAAVGIGAGGAILEVALDGTADVGELAADLVVTTGEEFHFHQVVPIGALQECIFELRFLRLSPGTLGDEGLVESLVAGHPVGQHSRFRRRLAATKGPVGLVDLPAAEHRVQALQGLGCLREQADAAHGAAGRCRSRGGPGGAGRP